MGNIAVDSLSKETRKLRKKKPVSDNESDDFQPVARKSKERRMSARISSSSSSSCSPTYADVASVSLTVQATVLQEDEHDDTQDASQNPEPPGTPIPQLSSLEIASGGDSDSVDGYDTDELLEQIDQLGPLRIHPATTTGVTKTSNKKKKNKKRTTGRGGKKKAASQQTRQKKASCCRGSISLSHVFFSFFVRAKARSHSRSRSRNHITTNVRSNWKTHTLISTGNSTLTIATWSVMSTKATLLKQSILWRTRDLCSVWHYPKMVSYWQHSARWGRSRSGTSVTISPSYANSGTPVKPRSTSSIVASSRIASSWPAVNSKIARNGLMKMMIAIFCPVPSR